MDSREHARDLSLRRTYGITLSEYKAVLASQGHACPVCLKPLTGISNPVDHSHKTGITRGILCHYCNRRRIAQHEDWQIVQRMADYLKMPPARRVIGLRIVPKKKPKKKTTRPR